MIGIVVAAHGDLADALLNTARSVFSGGGPISAVGITDDDAARYEARLQKAVEEVSSEHGVLVITDMFGGTPSNVGLMIHQPGRVEVLTGANLPMLIKAMQLSTEATDLTSVSTQVKEYSQKAIAVASEVLGVTPPAEDAEVKTGE